MSYDVWLEIDTGGPEATRVNGAYLNYTYNCAPMFRAALGGDGLRGLSGLLGGEAAGLLADAVAAMEAAPEHYRAMNPPNGWGDYDSALRFLETVRAECHMHPKARVVVS